MNAEFVRSFVKDALIASKVQAIPRGHGDRVLTRKKLVMTRDESYSVIVGGEEQPVIEPMLNAEGQELLDLRVVVRCRPRDIAANVLGDRSDQMAALPEHPDGNALPAKAAHYAEGAIVCRHN
jgi:hypothetical protein